MNSEIENKNPTIKNANLDSSNSVEVQNAVKKLVEIDPWEEIGFHRPLASFWYGLSIALFTAIVSLFFISLIFQLLYPYPEMQGYNVIAGGLFAIIYQVFDMGTAFGIERFIGEYRIKDPKKMLEYVRFFIWYQMFTGLVQVAILSVWILQYIRFSIGMSYLTWLFLIICQKQYPGMLGTFSAVLKGLQKFNKSQILGFVGGAVFQNLTNVVFIILGRLWGQQTPNIGDLMGGAIGFAIGSYIDDFFTMMLAGHFLNKELKLLGYNLHDAIIPSVSRPVIKQCLVFGFQASMVPLLNIVSETIILLLFLENLPQYATWVVLKSFAGSLTGVVNVGNFEITSAIAESYSNGKKKLTQFYVSYALKWNSFLKVFLITVMLSILPLISQYISAFEGLENYQSATIFIPFLLIEQLFFAFIEISDPILIGTLHVPFYTVVRLGEEVIRVIILFVLLEVFHLGLIGPIGICLTLGWDRFYARLVKMLAALIYINRKVFKVEIYWMSSVVIPLIAALPVLGLALSLNIFIVPILIEFIGLIPSAIIALITGIIIIPIIIFLPLVGFLGGFDDFQLETFRKSVELAGPSRFFVRAFYKVVKFGHEHCRWRNKFKIPWDVPLEQINELLIMKAQQTLDASKLKK